MDASLFLSVYLVFFGGLLVIACCILSLATQSKKGQVLFDLSSCPHKSGRSVMYYRR
jgi:hypothetical protein